MKKIFNILILSAVLLGATSCEKYLDINENPNTPTTATPNLVLPQALVGSASLVNTYSTSISDLGGQYANAGGFGGFGSVVTYNYTSSNFTGLWSSSYNILQDFQYVINETKANPDLAYSNSIARTMKAFIFSKLVDQYNDVPYSEALKGSEFLTPKYDKAETIYQDLVKELNESIKAIKDAQAKNTTVPIATTSDPIFKGNMTNWMKFANTLKLRLLIKLAGVPATASFAKTEFTGFDNSLGFLTDDATSNPGYIKEDGRQAPVFNSLAFAANGTTRQITSRIPSKWMFSFYSGAKLNDKYRGSVIYRLFPNTPVNQLGDESASVPAAPSGTTAFFTGANGTVTALGVAKGPTQDQPIMIKAESDFLQAEAIVRGYLTVGNAKTAFDNGITASFRYLYKNATNTVDPTKDVAGDVALYKADNPTSYLVNFDLATNDDEKLEAIITQKYIALNLIASDEAYSEFKRTGFPKIVNGSLDPFLTFASRQSTSSRSDKLVSRILYPQSEYNLNSANAPGGIGLFTSRIFWDLN